MSYFFIFFNFYEVSFQNILARTVNNTSYVCVGYIYSHACMWVGARGKAGYRKEDDRADRWVILADFPISFL